MNRGEHGQVLVSFILILPFILVLFIVVIDQGMLLLDKNNLNNLAYYACEYKNNNDEQIKKILKENDKKLTNIKITRDKDEIIEVSFQKETEAIFGKIVGYKKYNLKIKKECKRG